MDRILRDSNLRSMLSVPPKDASAQPAPIKGWEIRAHLLRYRSHRTICQPAPTHRIEKYLHLRAMLSMAPKDALDNDHVSNGGGSDSRPVLSIPPTDLSASESVSECETPTHQLHYQRDMKIDQPTTRHRIRREPHLHSMLSMSTNDASPSGHTSSSRVGEPDVPPTLSKTPNDTLAAPAQRLA